jgi:hypothetical protein
VRLLVFSMLVASGAALAQTTGLARSVSVPPSDKDEVPPGGCTPVGVTASGEIVFPLACKAFLERIRGPIEESKPAELNEKPVQVEKVQLPAAAIPIQADAPVQNEPVIQPAETIPLPKPRTGKWRRPKAEPPEGAVTANGRERVGRRHQQALSRATQQRPS